MTPEDDPTDAVGMPALLRAARRTYGTATRAALAEVDCDDVPRNGAFVIGAVARAGSQLSEVIDALGISKQAAGQLVDTLVLRGYLDRAADPADRRRLTVTLTERGRLAAAVSRSEVERFDAALVAEVGADDVAATRSTLLAIAALPLGEAPPRPIG